ncbi:hypothetical protein V6N13_023108 [Hibiscus sabdariffa]|uniref:RNase H type-1 domain-containing protein n=1 Tax=Hibiscus sabdariffa TaxID=183260 RepID=A0ABR2NWM9_9ROSI
MSGNGGVIQNEEGSWILRWGRVSLMSFIRFFLDRDWEVLFQLRHKNVNHVADLLARVGHVEGQNSKIYVVVPARALPLVQADANGIHAKTCVVLHTSMGD